MLISHAVLAHAGRKRGEANAAEKHAAEAARLASTGAAAWTSEIVERLGDDGTARAVRRRKK